MWLPKKKEIEKTEGNGIVAVAVNNDKGSQQALKWATDHLLSKGETLVLIHVVKRASSSPCNSLSLSLMHIKMCYLGGTSCMLSLWAKLKCSFFKCFILSFPIKVNRVITLINEPHG